MEIVTQDEVKSLQVGPGITILVKPMVLDVVEDVKLLTPDQHTLIIQDGKIEVPSGMEDRDLLYLALSFAQNAWYAATQGDVPQGVLDGHEARLTKFAKAAERARKNPPIAANTTSKEPKAAKAPKEPKTPKEPKAAKVAVAKTQRNYAVNPAGDVTIVGNLTGFRKSFYDAIRAAGKSLTRDEVLAATVAAGAQFKTDGAAQSQVNYQLKELVSSNLVLAAEEPAAA
jgi:hypothetical protein